MASGRKCFSITWRIENYNFLKNCQPYGISGPSFNIDSEKDTSWHFRIYENNIINIMKKGHLVFCIHRKALNPATDLGLDFEISFFYEDDSSVIFEDSYMHTFCIEKEFLSCYVPHNQVYVRKRSKFHPPKTLTIRCRIFKRDGSFLEVGQCFARTRIEGDRTAFIAVLERFSSLIPGVKRTLTIKSASTENQLTTWKIYLGSHVCCKDKLWIQILPLIKNYLKFCIFELLIFDSEGKKIKCGNDEFLLKVKTKEQDWNIPLIFTKGYLMERKTQFLSNDTLTLKCELARFTGLEYNRMEDSEFGNLAFVTEHPKLLCVSEDLLCLYDEDILSDVKIQTESNTFNVHKNILSARSSVFKTMFTTDMREKTADSVIIEDLEVDTVRRMLIFIYSDKLEDLDWEKAKSLYFAAHKYNIVGLKHRCSRFLETRLQIPNCCELLLLADRHQDGELKKRVYAYIADYREEIFRSDQWTNLEKSNPELSTETFHAVYLTKL